MEYKIFVGPKSLIISPGLVGLDKDRVSNTLKFRPNSYMFTKAYKLGSWDGYIKLYKRGQAPSGCFNKVANALKRFGHSVDIYFANNYVPHGDGKIFGLNLDEFQIEAAKKAIKYRYCVVKAAVRAGKTAIMARIISSIKHFPVLVITKSDKSLVKQIRNNLSKLLNRKVGIYSEGEADIRDIVVSHYQAIIPLFSSGTKNRIKRSETVKKHERMRKLVKDCKVLLLDECHHAFSTEFRNTLEKQFDSAGYRIGLSGTPCPKGITQIEFESVLGPIVYRIGFGELINSGRLSKSTIVIYDLPSKWFDHMLIDFNEIYESNIVRNSFRNGFVADLVGKFNDDGKSVLVMVSKIHHGENLRELISNSFFVRGKIDSKTREIVYRSLQDGKIGCVISTVGKEGLDLPKLDIVINAEGFSSSVITIQKMRSLTAHKDKKMAYVIDFVDKGDYLYNASIKRKKLYSKLDGIKMKNKRVPKDYIPGRLL